MLFNCSKFHEKNKQFACTLCDGKFSLKSNLKSHVITVHDKPFTCQHCDKVFKDNRQFKWHIATLHGGKLTIDDILFSFKKLEKASLNL